MRQEHFLSLMVISCIVVPFIVNVRSLTRGHVLDVQLMYLAADYFSIDYT